MLSGPHVPIFVLAMVKVSLSLDSEDAITLATRSVLRRRLVAGIAVLASLGSAEDLLCIRYNIKAIVKCIYIIIYDVVELITITTAE